MSSNVFHVIDKNEWMKTSSKKWNRSISFSVSLLCSDVYASKCTLNIIVARCTYEWRWSRRVAWGSDECTRSINLLWRKALSFLLRYPLGEHPEAPSEFIAVRGSSVFMNDWGIDRVTFGQMPSVTSRSYMLFWYS